MHLSIDLEEWWLILNHFYSFSQQNHYRERELFRLGCTMKKPLSAALLLTYFATT
ncbi:MAG: hypothetical protein ACI8RD_014305, partial [Bacillariaceae sp.]